MYGRYPSLGIGQSLEEPHVEIKALTAIRFALASREECERLQLG
jgi:hypothetical protein